MRDSFISALLLLLATVVAPLSQQSFGANPAKQVVEGFGKEYATKRLQQSKFFNDLPSRGQPFDFEILEEKPDSVLLRLLYGTKEIAVIRCDADGTLRKRVRRGSDEQWIPIK